MTEKSITFTIECKIEFLKLSNKYKVKLLCKIAEVSLSGYLKNKKLIETFNTKEQREKLDLEIVKIEFLKHKEKHGYRIIVMDLKKEGIIMNSKKVLRIMNKYSLKTKIRIKRPY